MVVLAAVAVATLGAERDTARVMSEENVRMARELYSLGPIDHVAVFSDPTLLSAFRTEFEPRVHPDFEVVFETVGDLPAAPLQDTQPDSQGEKRSASGIDGFIAAWGDWMTAWESWVPEPVDYIEAGDDRVLVLIDVQARSKTHQVEMLVEGANLLTIEDGKVTRLELFMDRTNARTAAGLSE